MWAWIWFSAFVCALGAIVILIRARAIDREKAQAAFSDFGTSIGDEARKAKQQWDTYRKEHS